MPGIESNPFVEAQQTHQELLGGGTVDRDSLLESLNLLDETGVAAVRSEQVGMVNFANQVTAHFAGALALNKEGNVRPPLRRKDTAYINGKIETYSIFTQENGATGPTDTGAIKTAGRK